MYKAPYSFAKVAPAYKLVLVTAFTKNGNKLRQVNVRAYTANQQEALSTVKTVEELKALIGYDAKEAEGLKEGATALSKFAA